MPSAEFVGPAPSLYQEGGMTDGIFPYSGGYSSAPLGIFKSDKNFFVFNDEILHFIHRLPSFQCDASCKDEHGLESGF